MPAPSRVILDGESDRTLAESRVAKTVAQHIKDCAQMVRYNKTQAIVSQSMERLKVTRIAIVFWRLPCSPSRFSFTLILLSIRFSSCLTLFLYNYPGIHDRLFGFSHHHILIEP